MRGRANGVGVKVGVAVIGAVALVVSLSGCGADNDEWLSANCAVNTGHLQDGQWAPPYTYLMGVGYSPSDFPLYTRTPGEDSIRQVEGSLPADTRVCFNAEAWVEAEAADASGTITVMPVAWDDEPDWDHYVKVTGHGGEPEEACRLDVEKTDDPCEGGKAYFRVDRKASKVLPQAD